MASSPAYTQNVPEVKPTSTNVLTRFPPEPNGYLHLGHSKAIAINFGFARFHGGETNLRFDDTNPGAEKGEYFTAIEENVSWLGFKPAKITYSSDNFGRLYELAEQLIQDDGAYVCHCSPEQVKAGRGAGEVDTVTGTRKKGWTKDAVCAS